MLDFGTEIKKRTKIMVDLRDKEAKRGTDMTGFLGKEIKGRHFRTVRGKQKKEY